jgi:beta-glucosidase
MMEKFRIYGERTQKPSPLELANRALAREAAKEGFVLLKNDGILPLQDRKIALYGAGARLTVKGGSGSGDVHERFSVNIEDGLKNAGFTIVNTAWLDRFTTNYEKAKAEFHEKVEDAIKGYPVWKVMDMFQKIGQFKLPYPTGDAITESDLTAETDTAIYVIARQAGEGDDRKAEKGDYLLSDLEVNNIKRCAEHFKKVLILLNCGGMLDLSLLDPLNIGAILYYGQAGEEGGNAVGEILSGKASPCGKLTDTWGKTYADYCTAHAHEKKSLDEDYREGIYVGYRFFDAMGIVPRYPFGYGLSYTTFEYKMKAVSVEKSVVRVIVTVKNTGNLAGKEVLQCYLAKPNNHYDGEQFSLTAFGKTKLLASGESDQLTLSFDLRDFAVYDELNAAFVLEAGEYGLDLGTNARDHQAIAVLHLIKVVLVEQCKNVLPKRGDFSDFRSTQAVRIYADDLPRFEIADIESNTNDYTVKRPEGTEKVQQYLHTLSDKELALFCMGGGYFAKTFNRVAGACGNTTSALLKKGIPNIIMSDGPAGINILPKIAYNKNGSVRYIGELPEQWQWGWLKKMVPKLGFLFAKATDTPVYQYCTAWPNATTLAQTWNTELIEQVGNGVGLEMSKMGITLWLAPALNIHRDPLCGRNFEYYSEDPLISGLMAAAITRGVQSTGGVGVTIKHFACNNREDDRTKMSSNLSERALREIYLKGFRIACKEQPWALMSSYNRINGIYAPSSAELLIDILRCEWNYQGLVMSDWDAVEQCSYTEAIQCGNNMIMPGKKSVYKAICKALDAGVLRREDLLPGAAYALSLIFKATTSKGF